MAANILLQNYIIATLDHLIGFLNRLMTDCSIRVITSLVTSIKMQAGGLWPSYGDTVL